MGRRFCGRRRGGGFGPSLVEWVGLGSRLRLRVRLGEDGQMEGNVAGE